MARKKQARNPRSKKGEVPQILRNKSRNRAFMLIEGRRYYLGVYDDAGPSLEAEENRLRVWAEYQAKKGPDPREVDQEEASVMVLVQRFLADAKTTYVKHGRSTGSYERFKIIVRPVVTMYGDYAVAAFTPGCLKAVRESMVASGLARKTVNDRVNLIRQIFRWGVENELVTETTWRALTAVQALKAGKTPAPERPDVEPVPAEIVAKTLPCLQQSL